MPKASVIIPSYNCGAFLARAVDSVLGQTMQDFQLLVVDDGSTDDTPEVLERYAADRRFRYLRQHNQGPSAARNLGARSSESEYLVFLDADDALAPEALALITAELDSSGASWCLVDMVKVIGEREEVWPLSLPPGNLFLEILHEDFIRCPMFFRRTRLTALGLYDETLYCREDWDINIRMLENREPFVYVSKALYRYTLREGSQTKGDPSRVLADTERVLRKHHKRLADAGDPTIAKIYAQNMWNLGRRYFYMTRNYRRALACMRESFAYDLSPARVFHPLVHHARRLRGNA